MAIFLSPKWLTYNIHLDIIRTDFILSYFLWEIWIRKGGEQDCQELIIFPKVTFWKIAFIRKDFYKGTQVWFGNSLNLVTLEGQEPKDRRFLEKPTGGGKTGKKLGFFG